MQTGEGCTSCGQDCQSGAWNTPGDATTKRIFVNGSEAQWGPAGGVSLSGNACVHTTSGSFTGWSGIGTW